MVNTIFNQNSYTKFFLSEQSKRKMTHLPRKAHWFINGKPKSKVITTNWRDIYPNSKTQGQYSHITIYVGVFSCWYIKYIGLLITVSKIVAPIDLYTNAYKEIKAILWMLPHQKQETKVVLFEWSRKVNILLNFGMG